jgi:predicted nuclease of restriction endonuclease-like (RecB) superfamily
MNLKSLPHPDYPCWLASLKGHIRTARIKASLAINQELIRLYWQIGHEIIQQRTSQNWGSKILEQVAKDLRHEFPDMRGLSLSNLKYMARFAEAWPEGLIGHQLGDQIPWKHNCLIIEKIKDRSTRQWYIQQTIENGWSRSVLEMQIDSQAHRRVGAATHNFVRTLPPPQSNLAHDILKDPYAFDFLGLIENTNERLIEKGLLTHLRDFLIELGVGFAFVASQYKLTVDGDEFFIDLLFYHTKLHCYVVIELKNATFKAEYTGQLNSYLAMVDDLVRDAKHDAPTIGMVLCKSAKKSVVEYALRGVSTPMGVSTYRTSPELPKEIQGLLPSIEALENELNVELIPAVPHDE